MANLIGGSINRAATLAEVYALAYDTQPGDIVGADVMLLNGIASTALVAGDLVMLDQTTTGVIGGEYARFIAPTAAGNQQGSGSIHLVVQEPIAASGIGRCRLVGDTLLNLNASSATIGTMLHTRSTNKDATTAVTYGGKGIGFTKVATTTGRVRCFFDGRGLAGPEYGVWHFNIGDETTDLATGTDKYTFYTPHAATLIEVYGSVATVATGATLLQFDVNEAGTTIFSTEPTFDASEATTRTAATPAVISDTAIASNAKITVDIVAVGNTTTGKGLDVYMLWYR